jgi:hypothetical protein
VNIRRRPVESTYSRFEPVRRAPVTHNAPVAVQTAARLEQARAELAAIEGEIDELAEDSPYLPRLRDERDEARRALASAQQAHEEAHMDYCARCGEHMPLTAGVCADCSAPEAA